MSTTREVLERIALATERDGFIISLGCAGWGPGQLEAEIRHNAWLTCAIDESILFEAPVDRRWDLAIRQLGIDPSLLVNGAGHA
jgi:putative transcriptional regulator